MMHGIESLKKEIQTAWDEAMAATPNPFDRDTFEEILAIIGNDAFFEACEEWIEDDIDEDEEGMDADSVVFERGEEGDVMERLLAENDSILEEWRTQKAEEAMTRIWSRSDTLEIVANELGIDPDLLAGNFQTGGKASRKLIQDTIGPFTEDFCQLGDHEIEELKAAMGVAHERHTQTAYDFVDKTDLDEFEVDELRRETNRFVQSEERNCPLT